MVLYAVLYNVFNLFIFTRAFNLEQDWHINSMLKAGYQEESYLNQNMMSDIKPKMHFLKKRIIIIRSKEGGKLG